MEAKELLEQYANGKRNFFKFNLTGMNLYGANLSGANLSNSNLSGANLSGANLNNVKFAGTDLRWVKFVLGIKYPYGDKSHCSASYEQFLWIFYFCNLLKKLNNLYILYITIVCLNSPPYTPCK